MAEVKWIKVTTDVFDDDKILLIESLPDADSIIVIWFKLLCLAGKQNNSGVFMMGNRIPYTEGMLATIFRRKETTVRLALQTFEQFGMIEIVDGVITLPNWGKHQNLDQLESRKEFMKNYMKEYRQKQKALTSSKPNCKPNCKPNSKPNVNCADKIRKEKNRTEEIREEEKETKPVRHKYGEYENVLLSDDDLEKLKSEFPYDWADRIENLSAYIASTGKSYKNHLATIRNWARKEQASKAQQQTTAKHNQSTGNPFLDLAIDENLF